MNRKYVNPSVDLVQANDGLWFFHNHQQNLETVEVWAEQADAEDAFKATALVWDDCVPARTSPVTLQECQDLASSIVESFDTIRMESLRLDDLAERHEYCVNDISKMINDFLLEKFSG